MKAEKLDKLFDEGKNITEFLDMSTVEKPKEKNQRVNVDFPVWMVEKLDKESKRLGVTRQSIIKFWIAEKLGKYSA